MKVCLQAGHVNCKNNSIVALRGSTGAPGEQNFTQGIVDGLVPILKSLGVEVTKTDSNANDDFNITSKDWDLFLSVHYDADIYNDSGGFTDFPEPITDSATKQSQFMANAISQEYFSITGIKNMPKRSNANTRYYYMWQHLSAKTPCVIIECGVGNRKPNDYNMLNINREKIVEALAKGIAKALGVAYTPTDLQKQIDELKRQLEIAKGDILIFKEQEIANKALNLKLNGRINELSAMLDQIKVIIGSYK
jgi:N-acetylmuramoyl-L-alanine amidase